MESKKLFYFKVALSILFASAVLGAFVYVCIRGDLQHNILSFCCIGACLVLSLIFVRRSAKKIVFTIAFAVNVVADYFLLLMQNAENFPIGVYVMAAVQVLYLVYTLFLLKGIGLKVLSLALRIGLCFLIYFLLPQYFVEIGIIQLLFAMIVANSLITLLVLLCYIKTQWLTFLGFLLYFAFNFFMALEIGWGSLLNFSPEFLTFIAAPYPTLPSLAFLCYIPAVLLLALSSVWESEAKSDQEFVTSEIQPVQNSNFYPATINRPAQTYDISRITLDDL